MKRKIRDLLGLLEPLGIVKTKPHPNYVAPGSDISAEWRSKFRALKRYVKREGHARVPQSYGTTVHPTLGRWVGRQRMAYRNERYRKAFGAASGSDRINNDQVRVAEECGFRVGGGEDAGTAPLA